ncbi:antitoxin VbhA family protein [Luteipulveratus halotolerans]|uniref:antitoxin VbhA family protein n=1 Tax=Luteipulveratus halotolerans TaxID=1631356 RepID=UPI002F406189
MLGRRSKVHPAQVEHIHDLLRQGKSHRDVADLTGLSRSIVGRVARNEIPSLAAFQPATVGEGSMSEKITDAEQARRRREVDEVRHSSAMEGNDRDAQTHADQEAYVRGDLTLDELIERA